jgi:hypothetical protein
VQVTRVDGSTLGPLGTHWAGLMLRNPDSLNHAHIVFGRNADNDTFLSVEWASAVNGATEFGSTQWTGGDTVELRLCRYAPNVRMYYRAVGATQWIVRNTVARADLPPTLRVGPVAHAWRNSPDLLARYEYARYRRITVESDCTVN